MQGSTIWKFCNRVGFSHIFSTPWFHVHIKDTFPSTHSSHFIIHISINTYSNNLSAIQAPSHLSGFRKWIRGLNLFSPVLSRDVKAERAMLVRQDCRTRAGSALRDGPFCRIMAVPKKLTVRHNYSTTWIFLISCPFGYQIFLIIFIWLQVEKGHSNYTCKRYSTKNVRLDCIKKANSVFTKKPLKN